MQTMVGVGLFLFYDRGSFKRGGTDVMVRIKRLSKKKKEEQNGKSNGIC